jgi:hypothetical protein
MNRLLAIVALVALSAAPALADPTNDVKNAMIGLANASSYHISATAAGHAMEGDFVKPGKMHLTAGPFEMIVIDKTTYVKMQGAWHQFTFPGMDRVMAPLSHAQNFLKSHDDITVTDLGPKVVGGATLHAYGVKNSTNSDRPITVYLDSSGTLVRIDVADNDGNTSTINFSNMNGPITIDPPV